MQKNLLNTLIKFEISIWKNVDATGRKQILIAKFIIGASDMGENVFAFARGNQLD